MALCVAVTGASLEVIGQYTSECAGYALMTAQEYASTPTLAALFAVPEPDSVQAAFMAGIGLPLILWLTAWGFGVVVNWFDHRFADTTTIED